MELNVTHLMHVYTMHELNKMHLRDELRLRKFESETRTELEAGIKPKIGKFDYFVETDNGKKIGFEILARPTKGKMVKKLAYEKDVDEFVFVLPEQAMEFYQKPKTKIFHKKTMQKFFGKEFESKKIIVWLFDVKNKIFVAKEKFNRVFNVE